MKRNIILKVLNPFLMILFINQAITGVFRDQIAGASHETWEVLHGGGGVLFILLAIMHIIVNFNWIKASYFKRKISQ